MDVIILSTVFVLFFLFLVIKKIFSIDFCALCLSVSTTWIIYITLYWLFGFFLSDLILVLMGGSVVGLFYLIKEKVKNKSLFNFYQLPVLLTMFAFVYSLINPFLLYYLAVFLFVIWLLFVLIYVFKNKSSLIKKSVKEIIECCKNW